MDDDYRSIQKVLDEALLSDQPLTRFHQLLPEINSDELVDSAWISGYSFWVKYKDGGKQSWIHSPEDTNRYQ